METCGSTRFRFMDPSICGQDAVKLDLDGAMRYMNEYVLTVTDDEYVCVPYNFA